MKRIKLGDSVKDLTTDSAWFSVRGAILNSVLVENLRDSIRWATLDSVMGSVGDPVWVPTRASVWDSVWGSFRNERKD